MAAVLIGTDRILLTLFMLNFIMTLNYFSLNNTFIQKTFGSGFQHIHVQLNKLDFGLESKAGFSFNKNIVSITLYYGKLNKCTIT